MSDSIDKKKQTRRQFVKHAAVAGAMFALADGSGCLCSAADRPFHLIPEDKGLSQEWLDSLVARGQPEIFSGAQLRFIGMPVGGIGCGQLYLGGDGRLWLWDILKCNYGRESDHGRRISAFTLGGHYAHPVAQGEQYTKRNGADVQQGFLVRTKAGTIIDRGSKNIVAEVFDGEYFIHKPDPAKRALNSNKGCHIDQVLGQAWGSFAQKVAGGQQSASIELCYGKLALQELAVDQIAGAAAGRAIVLVDGKEISAEFQTQEGRYVVRFPKGLGLKAGQKMEVRYV